MYAIYASGASAVLGGMIVMGIGYVIYGFIAPRFEVAPAAAVTRGDFHAARAIGRLLAAISSAGRTLAAAATLEQIRESGTIRLGYVARGAAVLVRDEGGKPAGYVSGVLPRDAVAAGAARRSSTEFVPVGAEERFDAVKEGKVDLLCAGGTPTVSPARGSVVLDPGVRGRNRRARARGRARAA